MSYDYEHTEDHCDKCNKEIGKENLSKLPFLFLDCNDKKHPDISKTLGYEKDVGYRQYYICKECLKNS